MSATIHFRSRAAAAALITGCFCLPLAQAARAGSLFEGGYRLLTDRAEANAQEFLVYQTMDSAFNHGFPSLYFGTVTPTVNPACVDDPGSPDGCATDVTRMDRTGTRFQVNFSAVASGGTDAYAGIDFVEPMNFGQRNDGMGYDLSDTTQILFSARSPTGITLQFGAGGQTTDPVTLPSSGSTYTTVCIAVHGSASDVCPSDYDKRINLAASIDLSNVHILFTLVTNHAMSPGGGVILLKDISYAPFPASRRHVPSLPLSTETFGIVPVQVIQNGRVPVPPDQVNRNFATIYEAALVDLALFARGKPRDMRNAFQIADALVYALHHENGGDALPPQSGGGLHNAYEAGDLPLFNAADGGTADGQVRLGGFSAAFCGPTVYCLVLDGATGGNEAFAILALLKAYGESGKQSYLDAAVRIGSWIDKEMRDRTKTGFGGYYVGFPDGGQAKVLETGKSTENNADIFAAFTALAAVETRNGDARAASQWTSRAKVAGDFVMNMFHKSRGCFYAGTVPAGTLSSAGIDPTGPARGNDVTNVFNFFDSDSFTYLAMAQSDAYGSAIDWSRVPACLRAFRQSVQAAGVTFHGYDLVEKPTCNASDCGPSGIAWEFTGQAAVVTRLSGGDDSKIVGDLRRAQGMAPFIDIPPDGLVAATMQGGDTLPPYQQCLSTPFQCIPERVSLAATAWGIFADAGYNPL